MYSKIDYNIIYNKNFSKYDDEIEENKTNDDNDKPGYNIRSTLSKIPSSWLLITNEKGFPLLISITPGIFIICNFTLILHYL